MNEDYKIYSYSTEENVDPEDTDIKFTARNSIVSQVAKEGMHNVEIKDVSFLYPSKLETESDLSLCLRLLKEGKNYLEQAIDEFDSNGYAADDNLLKFNAILKELFVFHGIIGEGYSIIISSLINTFINTSTENLERNQIIEIKLAITHLIKAPHIIFDEGNDLVNKLVSSGLDVSNKPLSTLIGIIDDA